MSSRKLANITGEDGCSPQHGEERKVGRVGSQEVSSQRSRRSSRHAEPPQSNKSECVTPPQTTSFKVTRSSQDNSHTILRPSNRLWTSRSYDVTCLLFDLDPQISKHRKVICQNLLKFFDVVLKNVLSNVSKKPRSQADIKYRCAKPWHPDNVDHVYEGKRRNMADFRSFFYCHAIDIVIFE